MTTISRDDDDPFMNVDQTQFDCMTIVEQTPHWKVEGCVILPHILDAGHIRNVREDMASVEMRYSDYSTSQTHSATQPRWLSPVATETISRPPSIDFLTDSMGLAAIITLGFFQRTLAVGGWDPLLVAGASASAQSFPQNLNTSGSQWNHPRKPDCIKKTAPGTNPGHWGDHK